MTSTPIRNGRALLPWLPLAAALLAIGAGWGQLTSAADQTDKNTSAIEKLDERLDAIDKTQVEIKTKLEAETKLQAERYQATSKALNQLLRAVVPSATPPR